MYGGGEVGPSGSSTDFGGFEAFTGDFDAYGSDRSMYGTGLYGAYGGEPLPSTTTGPLSGSGLGVGSTVSGTASTGSLTSSSGASSSSFGFKEDYAGVSYSESDLGMSMGMGMGLGMGMGMGIGLGLSGGVGRRRPGFIQGRMDGEEFDDGAGGKIATPTTAPINIIH